MSASHEEPLWRPSPERVARSNLTAFLHEVDRPAVTDFPSLYRWSVEEPEAFWPAVWDFCGVVASHRGAPVVENPDRMPGARWFPEARLNFAENLLRRRGSTEALVSWNEEGPQKRLSFDDLHAQVSRVAKALRAQGIGPGDRVAGFLPNLPETVIAMLAAASVGALWSSCSPDFGVKGVHDRFGQIEPRVLFAADGYRYGGKAHDSLARVREIARAIPTIERIVIVPYLNAELDLGWSDRAQSWGELLAPHEAGEIAFEPLPFDHPLYVMYSSGTTGLPKCMVHGAGGTLLQHLKEHVLHTDLRTGDRIFYFTTCGWMMWNWLVSALAVGATVVLYDGAPMKPEKAILWDLAEREHLTVFGTSAKYLALAEKEGLKPARSHGLGALRAILSTGSPLLPEGFDYVYRDVKADVCLSSISGGTDIISCFALGNPTGPVHRGKLQTRGLGMAVEIFDAEGRPVVGEKGELVCTRPFPSMPVHFWNDPEGERYRAAYFDHYPGVWRHGDWAELDEEGHMVIYGRSDATLNPGGVRIGTAEIYRQVEQFDEVLESLVIGQEWHDDLRIVLFVRLREGTPLTDELRQRLQKQIRENASPHHVPKKILAVPDIPKTLSGKITELAVRDVVHGREIDNADALANPEALDHFRGRPELRS